MKTTKTIDIARVKKDVNEGLSTNEVEQRVSQGLVNVSDVKTDKTYFGILVKNVCTVINLICFVIVAAVLYVKEYASALFAIIFIANLVIGTVQEMKAKRTIDKLSLVAKPDLTVVRNGEKVKVKAENIVVDDIVYYGAGEQIVADAEFINGYVEVNESMLTGESRPIKKHAGDKLFAGSFVSAGGGYARVMKVGKDNYIEGLSAKARKFKAPKSELVVSLNKIVRILCIILIVLGIPLFILNSTRNDGDLTIAVTRTAGSLVGMIPAGMFLLTSVALAAGIVKLARKKTLIKDLYGIEMLARSDVLCLDKTGTITDGTMKVENIELLSDTGVEIEKVLKTLITATNGSNATAVAISKYCANFEMLDYSEALPFSSERKKSAVETEIGTFVLGASEFVLSEMTDEFRTKLNSYMSKGLRVLTLASGGSINDGELVGEFKPVALIVLSDCIRPDARDTIAWFKENNVEIKIISGDDPVAVSSIAAQVGVVNAERFINLEGLSEDEVRKAAKEFTVFGRVTPEQKFYLVNELKRNGKTVAMTGDGVNDILAFREADCSIAMAEGSEAARRVATVVLLNSEFSVMPDVVVEGRRVINNIQKSSSLFLMKNIFTIFFTIIIMCIPGATYPITPNRLVLYEFAVIGIPSFMLALQPNKEIIKGRFIVTVMSAAVPYALVFLFNALFTYILKGQYALSYEDMLVYSMNYIGFVALVALSLPLNKYRFFLCLGSVIVITLGTIVLPKVKLGGNPILDIEMIGGTDILILCALIAVAALLLFAFIKLSDLLTNRLFDSQTGRLKSKLKE